jgi:hypothetical protein
MLFHNTTDTRMAARHGFCRKPIKDSCWNHVYASGRLQQCLDMDVFHFAH